eukprot:gene9795-biopygen2882
MPSPRALCFAQEALMVSLLPVPSLAKTWAKVYIFAHGLTIGWNSCHEECVRDRNRAGIQAADPARYTGSAASIPARFRSQTPSSSLAGANVIIDANRMGSL